MNIVRKILKWLGYAVGTVLASAVILYIGFRIYSPPYQDQIRPDKVDLMASGTPAMPLPLGKLETYEPHIAIDPNNPDHIVAAAMYGNRQARAGNYLYRWRTMDGGKSWTHETMPTYAHPGKFVADVVAGINADGTEHYISMYGDIAVPDDAALLSVLMLPVKVASYVNNWLSGRPATIDEESEEEQDGGISMVRGNAQSGKFDKPIRVSSNGTSTDKTWMGIDTSPTSPYKGNIYSAWTLLELNGDIGADVVVSRDNGKTYSKSVTIMKPGYAVAVSTRPDGSVDIIGLKGLNTSLQTITHVVSTDGGRMFSKPGVISGPADKTVKRDLPALAAAPDGTVLACWVESNDRDVQTRVKCTAKRGTAPWSSPADIAPDLPLSTKMGFPAVAANEAGLWVLAYKGDSKTEVVLYRSIDQGKSFTLFQTLGSRSFGRDDLCIGSAHDTGCRFWEVSHKFLPGDYVGLSATGNRVAAAFVLPRGNVPYMFANTYVKVIDVPNSPAAEKSK